MPRKTRAVKRKPRRRRRKANPRRRMVLSGFPSRKRVKLRYTDATITIDPGAGLTASNVFRANSVYDPDFTNTGHQPMGFDQWAVIYSRYTVLGAKITVKQVATTASNLTPGFMGITLSTESDPLGNFSSINNVLESKLTSPYISVGPIRNASGSGKTDPTITKYFSARKFFGKKDLQDGNSTSAVVTTNPSDTAYFAVWLASIDGNNPSSMSFCVIIDYIVDFHEPKTLDGS